MKNKFSNYIDELQKNITDVCEKLDGKSKFIKNPWKRSEGGGGLTMVIEDGNVFEKGGVNVSKIFGKLPKIIAEQLNVNGADFFACGLSLVLHPKNPMAPTVHANFRYFETYKDGALIDQWFGGGTDLTPYYLFQKDAIHFHEVCKQVCDRHDENFYKKYKQKCDEYFWNSHRNEARGIGGLFFDYCRPNKKMSINDWFLYVSDLGNSFLDSYVPIIERRKKLSYNDENKKWQEIRRGRYVEFNLLHDKGTLFGLKTNGRIESIFISLPPKVQWVYDFNPKKNSEEHKLVEILKSPIKWV